MAERGRHAKPLTEEVAGQEVPDSGPVQELAEGETQVQGASSPAAEATPPAQPALWGSPLAYKLVRGSLMVLLAAGLGIMLYPAAQRARFMYKTVQQANEYDAAVAQWSEDELEAEWHLAQLYNEARVYNRAHRENAIVDPFSGDPRTERLNDEYWNLLNPMGTGVMGYMDIPHINQRLNIYHGTDEDALLKGVGHIQGTSLPVGGAGTHCVVSGHRGLPGAKIFTDLDQMEVGDAIKLHILNHRLQYEVDQILVVKPEEIGAIDIVEGQDLITLVTCTPYAVNTHRLLVRGHRVPYVEDPMPVVDALGWLTPARIALLCGLALVLLVLAVVLVRRRKRKANLGPKDG